MNLDDMRRLDALKTYKELEDAKAEIERLRKANLQLREGAEEQKQRIKRLEESGDAMAAWLSDPRNLGDDPFMSSQWRKVKEAKP